MWIAKPDDFEKKRGELESAPNFNSVQTQVDFEATARARMLIAGVPENLQMELLAKVRRVFADRGLLDQEFSAGTTPADFREALQRVSVDKKN